MKLRANMMIISDANRNSFPPALSLVLSKKGMLYNNKVPKLTIHEKTDSDICFMLAKIVGIE